MTDVDGQNTNPNKCFMSLCVSDFFTEVMVKVHVVDLKSETIASPISVRAYLNQTITEFKQLIAQVSYSSKFLLCIFFSFLIFFFYFKHKHRTLCKINLLPMRSVMQT